MESSSSKFCGLRISYNLTVAAPERHREYILNQGQADLFKLDPVGFLSESWGFDDRISYTEWVDAAFVRHCSRRVRGGKRCGNQVGPDGPLSPAAWTFFASHFCQEHGGLNSKGSIKLFRAAHPDANYREPCFTPPDGQP